MCYSIKQSQKRDGWNESSITYGTFDVLHYGHIRLLKRAKEMGDYLIVGLSTDAFNTVKGKKAYYTFEQRKEILESLKYVDLVIPENNWNQKINDINKFNVNTLVMGSDWAYDPKFESLKKYCDVVYLDRTKNVSSTETKIYLGHNNNNLKLYNKVAIYLFKFHLKFIYLFFKLFKTNNNKIVFISRRSNKIPIEFNIIIEALNKYNLNTVILCKKIKKGIKNKITYYFEIIRQMYHLSTSKICITDSYCIPISVLKHKKNLKIIQSWHAMGAIKKFGYQNLDKEYGRNSEIAKLLNMHRNYDYVVSGSSIMNKYFAEAFNTDISKIHAIGSPTVDYLIKYRESIKLKIMNKYPDIKNKPVILYIPTFRNKEIINIDKLVNCIDHDKYNLVVNLHPNSKLECSSDNYIRCSGIHSIELLTIADYIITDYSSIMIEASLMNKPLFLYVYDYDSYLVKNGLNVNLFEELPNAVFKDPKDIIDIIESNTYDLSIVNNFCNKFVTNKNGYATDILVNYILSNLEVEEVNYEKNKIYTDTTV